MAAYLLLAASTLASEDLACIAAGVLAAHGSIDFYGAAAVGRVWHRARISAGAAGAAALVVYLLPPRWPALAYRILHGVFWPPYIAYLPLLPYLLWLAVKHRSLTLFTAANPGIPLGGLTGESKSDILSHLRTANGFVPRFRLLCGGDRTEIAGAWMRAEGLDFPVVLKPDVGERGRGVAVIRSADELRAYLRTAAAEVIVQEYVPGLEFGIFYYRMPGWKHGRIFSI